MSLLGACRPAPDSARMCRVTRPELPPGGRQVSRFLKDAFGGAVTVHAYYDDDESHVVAVVTATGAPHPDLVTFSTASLHASPNYLDDSDLRVELFAVGEPSAGELANVIATSAFFVQKNGWLAAPGVTFENAVKEYFPATTVPHLMWVEPFDFAALSPSPLSVDQVGPVHFLQGVPISQAEYVLLRSEGFNELERRLAASEALHYDLTRESTA